MKRVPSLREVPELIDWVRAIEALNENLVLNITFLLDGKSLGNTNTIPLTEAAFRKRFMFYERIGDIYLVEEQMRFTVNCSGRFLAKLKGRKIPSTFTIDLIWS